MNKITFNDTQAHECTAKEQGEWIVFTCSICPNYRRKMHRETGEMINETTGDAEALHQGFYVSGIVDDFNSSLS